MSELRNSVLKENRRTDGRHFATVWTGLIRGRPNQSILASLSLNPTIPVADKFMKSWPARWTSWLIQKDEGQPGKPKFSVSHSHYFLPQQHLQSPWTTWKLGKNPGVKKSMPGIPSKTSGGQLVRQKSTWKCTVGFYQFLYQSTLVSRRSDVKK